MGVVDGALDGLLCDFDSRPEGRVRGEHRARRAFWTSHAAETPTRRDDMRSRSRACTFRVERRGDAYGGCCRRRRSTSTPRASRPRSIDRRAQNSVVVHHAADFTTSRPLHRVRWGVGGGGGDDRGGCDASNARSSKGCSTRRDRVVARIVIAVHDARSRVPSLAPPRTRRSRVLVASLRPGRFRVLGFWWQHRPPVGRPRTFPYEQFSCHFWV